MAYLCAGPWEGKVWRVCAHLAHPPRRTFRPVRACACACACAIACVGWCAGHLRACLDRVRHAMRAARQQEMQGGCSGPGAWKHKRPGARKHGQGGHHCRRVPLVHWDPVALVQVSPENCRRAHHHTRHARQRRQPQSVPAAISDCPSDLCDKSTTLMVASVPTPRGSPGNARTTTRCKRAHKMAEAPIIRYLGCRPAVEAGPRS
jgi:hypothetical protein